MMNLASQRMWEVKNAHIQPYSGLLMKLFHKDVSIGRILTLWKNNTITDN